MSYVPPATTGSIETSEVDATHPLVTDDPKHVSRRRTCKWTPGPAGTRLEASVLNTTKRPSALTEGLELSKFPFEPSSATDTVMVCGVQPSGTALPRHISRR